MSEMKKVPEQMPLPFESTGNSSSSAKILFFAQRNPSFPVEKHENNIKSVPSEKDVLKRVLERANLLTWYK